MELVKPKIFHIGYSAAHRDGIAKYLGEIGAYDFSNTFMPLFDDTSKPADAEMIIELMGRECYRSFQPGLNPNVTKVREGNKPYVRNILDSKHGSVLEHCVDNYIFLYCSRVFTHEMVRNRGEILGNAFSQESLRYVRLDELKCWYPTVFAELQHCKPELSLERAKEKLFALWTRTFQTLEAAQIEMATLLDLDNMKNFSIKKKLTSAMRRLAPIGLATSIGFTANHRAMRWAITQRTDAAAEEEMRMIFGMVFDEQVKCYPNIYQDNIIKEVDGLRQISFENYKV